MTDQELEQESINLNASLGQKQDQRRQAAIRERLIALNRVIQERQNPPASP